MFEREDWTLFRTLGTIGQKAGVTLWNLPRLVAKELADNALDAGGSCQVDRLEGNGFVVEDDGPGIPGTDAEVASLFSIRRPLVSSKLIRLPTRGAMGNGLRVVAGSVLASAGELIVSTRGRTLRLIPRDSGETDHEVLGPCDRPGTRVDVRFGRGLVVTDESLEWAYRALDLAGPDAGLSYQGKTSPWWYDSDSFFELCSAATTQTVADLVEVFDGLSGRKGLAVAKTFGKGRKANTLDRAEAESLLSAMKQQVSDRGFNPDRLGRVGPVGALPSCYHKISGTFIQKAARGPSVAELPFVVEAWAEEADEPEFIVCVNRTPITAHTYTRHEKGEQALSVGARWFTVRHRRPRRIWLNVLTPYMPITTDGKAPDFTPIHSQIQAVMGKAADKVKGPEAEGGGKGMTQKAAILACVDEGLAIARGEKKSRCSERQLYYKVREKIKQRGYPVKEPTWDYFQDVIRDHENELGHDLPGLYRDTRGVLCHPHTGQEIPLGTLHVEGYDRPPWTFNKVVYCEKEGFFPILKDMGWAELNDCALMTSKGFASRAARDIIDKLGVTESAEPIQFFCIHDADASGTLIYQSIQDETKSRGARDVEIINLGLDPWEAVEMGLEPEPVEASAKQKPVARYVLDYDEENGTNWAEWLQTHRIELNAMTSPQFIEFLDRKIAPHLGKVVPPAEVLADRLEQRARAELERRWTARVMRRARIDERVERSLGELRPDLAAEAATLESEVRRSLDANPIELWHQPVERVARKITRRRKPKAG